MRHARWENAGGKKGREDHVKIGSFFKEPWCALYAYATRVCAYVCLCVCRGSMLEHRVSLSIRTAIQSIPLSFIL